MTAKPTSRLLHVANGTSTTRIIKAAGIPGACSIWADPLYEGPVPAGLSDTDLLAVRKRFLAGPSDLKRASWGGGDPSLDPANDMHEWRAVIQRNDEYDELILWFEHDLFDQLNLIQLLDWIRVQLPEGKPVSLICIGAFPGRPGFKGLGELTPGELAPLLEIREPVSDAQYTLASRAWHAFRQPTPESLDELRRGETSALPYLAPAITRFLQEYPWTSDGLSRSERRLLELAIGGASLIDVFPRMHYDERFYYVTDLSLVAMAEMMSTSSPPLLALEVSGDDRRPLHGTVSLTEAGGAVLSRQQDRIALCGVDRWLGGVHLEGRHVRWRWDDGSQRMVPA